MSNVTSESSAGGSTSDGFEAFANLNDGFLGTGYSSSVEVSFIAMALIFGTGLNHVPKMAASESILWRE